MTAALPLWVTSAASQVRWLSLRWLTPLTRRALGALGVLLPDMRPARPRPLGEDETAWREFLTATDCKLD